MDHEGNLASTLMRPASQDDNFHEHQNMLMIDGELSIQEQTTGKVDESNKVKAGQFSIVKHGVSKV